MRISRLVLTVLTAASVLLGLGCQGASTPTESVSEQSQALGFDTLRRVSLSSVGAEGHGDTGTTIAKGDSVSADGNVVVFASNAQDLVPSPQNSFSQVYAKRMDTGELTRVSQEPDGTPGNWHSGNVVLSADGRIVSFNSGASNLALGAGSGREDVFVYDLGTGATEAVSVDLPGDPQDRASSDSSVSADGQFVAFLSQYHGEQSIFVRDRSRAVTERVSDVGIAARESRVSADGRYVAFVAITAGPSTLMLRDRLLGTTSTLLQGSISDFSMSGDAEWFAFRGEDGTVPGDNNGKSDVFLLNRSTNALTLISRPAGGGQSNQQSDTARVNGDGRFVVFYSSATNLLPNTNGGVFIYDRTRQTLEVVASNRAYEASLSTDGRFVAFTSLANDVVPGDTNGGPDVFLGDRGAGGLIGTIAGVVRDVTGRGIEGVTVTASGPGMPTTTTNASGAYAFPGLGAGTYVVQAAKPGWSFGSAALVASERTVTVPPGAPALTITGYHELPIVFVHGWMESNREFGGLDDTLRLSGYHTSFSVVETDKLATPSMEVNALHLRDAVDNALNVTGQSKVIVVAHSMGGLVARAYFEGAGAEDKVASLFSFGTPHLGVPPGTLGLAATAECTITGGRSAGVCQMTKPGIDIFNQMYAPRAGVDYHSVAGNPPLLLTKWACKRFYIPYTGIHVKTCVPYPWCDYDSRSPAGCAAGVALSLSDELARLGGEDGFIARPSALGVGPLLDRVDRYTTSEVHDLILGPRDYFEDRDGNFSRESYRLCLEPVLAHRARSCGIRNPLSVVVPGWVPPAPLAAQPAPPPPGSAVAANGSGPAPTDLSAFEGAALLAGQTLSRTIAVEGGRTLFTGRWTSGSVAMTLVDPTGKTIDPQFLAAQDVDAGSAETTSTTIPNDFGLYTADAQTALYDFPNALPGQWTILLKAGADVPAGGTKVESFVAFSSNLHASATVDQRFYAPGSPARIAMTFSSPPDSAVVQAFVLRADGGSDTVTLASQGGGIYAASYTVPAVAGFARIVVKATGKFGGAPFERGALLMAQITTRAVSLNGGYTDQAEPAPGNPSRKQALRVDVRVNSTFSGQVGVAADLVDGVGNFVAHAVTVQTVTSGASTLALRFSADQIFAAHVNGPYTLTHLLLVDQRSAPIVAARADNVYQTAAYDYRVFAAAPDMPVLRLDDPYAVAEGSTTTLDATAVDPEGDAPIFAWDLDGDGTFETSGQAPTFAAGTIDGPALRPVRVRVSDAAGHSVEASTTVDITNVTPSFVLGDPVHLAVGDTLQRTRAFVDPGPDVWTATVDYGDGTPAGGLAVSGRSLTLDHRYTSAGTFVVKVVVADDDGGRSEASLLVDVTGPNPACALVGTASPAFVYVPPDITTASCGAIDLGTPDACGAGPVTVTNDAPAKLRPGTTTVTWTARDGAGHTVTATQRVTLLLGDDAACCPAGTNVIVGTSNNDTLNGTAGPDCILGRGGQDTINGLGGDDFVSAGDGDDIVSGGIGNDVLFGGAGQDRLTGDAGNDALFGGDGDDTLRGSAGDDTIAGGQGQDQQFGEDGNDKLFGGDGNDTLNGGNGNDSLVGNVGADVCSDAAGTNTFATCETAPVNSCTNGVVDGAETAVDCGGGCDARCGEGNLCGSGNDCASFLCQAGRCAPSSGIGTSTSGLLQPALQVTSDWGSGYCVTLAVINNAPFTALTWNVGINLNGATTSSTSNGTFSGSSGAITVTPTAAFNRSISAFAADRSIGFCANRSSSSSSLPSVTSAAATFF